MKLGTPPQQYDLNDQAQMRAAIEQADGQSHKKTGNIEVGAKKSVILTDTVTGHRYALTVASGALTLTAL
jgi:hypothetical protein